MRIDGLSDKQLEILKFCFEDAPYLICDGAVRSGKTMCMGIAFLVWAMECFDRTNFAVCAKTVGSAEKNLLIPLQAVEGLPYRLQYNVTKRMMTARCGRRENYFYVYGGKDESSYQLIQGITLAGVLMDEVALMPRSFVDQAIARTLTFSDAKIWFNCNPSGPSHWFYQEWIRPTDEGKRRGKHLHFLMTDNPIIGKDELKRAEESFSGVFYDRYIRGLWVAAEGAIYRPWCDDPARYTRAVAADELCHTAIGVDFGGNGSAHAFVLVGFLQGFKGACVLREYYRKEIITPDELERDFADFVAGCVRDYGTREVRCDSAETTLIRGFKTAASRAGLPVQIHNARKGEIVDRIRFVLRLMGRGAFWVDAGCKHLRQGLSDAVWDSKSATKDKRLDDGSINIDSLDAMEYAMEPYMSTVIAMDGVKGSESI